MRVSQGSEGADHGMQALKCERCGGDLETWNVADEGLYGRCAHCKTTYLINEVDHSHVVVDVRLPAGLALGNAPSLSRRSAIVGGVVVAAAAWREQRCRSCCCRHPAMRPRRRRVAPCGTSAARVRGPDNFVIRSRT